RRSLHGAGREGPRDRELQEGAGAGPEEHERRGDVEEVIHPIELRRTLAPGLPSHSPQASAWGTGSSGPKLKLGENESSRRRGLFVTQRLQGIDSRCSSGWEVTR